jgi:hypothetical protein
MAPPHTAQLAVEHTAVWPQVTAKLTDDPHGQALLDALDDERQLHHGPVGPHRRQSRLPSAHPEPAAGTRPSPAPEDLAAAPRPHHPAL